MILKSLSAEIAALRSGLAAHPGNESEMQALTETFLMNLEEDIRRLGREQESRQAEELQMEMALCFSEDAVSITAMEGDIRLVNPAFERLTGYAGAEIIGRTHEMFWGKVPVKSLADMKAAINENRQWRGEMNCETKTGELPATELSVTPIISSMGIATHFVFIQRDITARRKMQEKLNEQKTLLEKVINLASNAIMVIGPGGEWELDNIQAKTLLSDMGKGSRPRLAGLLLAQAGNSSNVKGRKIEITLANGQAGHYLMEAERIPSQYLIPDSGGGNLYLITLTDITQLETKTREALVRQKALAASKIEQGLAQNELANGFIYRMRQPLNVGMAISARLAELLKKDDPESLEINAKLMREQMEKMEVELLQFKEQSRPPDIKGRCAASALKDGLEMLFRDRCRAAGIRLEIDCTAEDVVLPVSEEMLQIVLIKMLDNSCESVEGKTAPRVKLSLHPRGDYLTIAVDDNGPGIPEKERYAVFEPFHTTKPNRTGLSLALVHQIINRAGGWVHVEESGLGGARFSLRLPLAEGPCPT